MDQFLFPLVKELMELECGFAIHNQWYKFFLLFAVLDKPARALILNSKLASSFYGCIKCEIKGESVPYGNGKHVVFENEGNLRTHSSYLSNLKTCKETKKECKGIFKGTDRGKGAIDHQFFYIFSMGCAYNYLGNAEQKLAKCFVLMFFSNISII